LLFGYITANGPPMQCGAGMGGDLVLSLGGTEKNFSDQIFGKKFDLRLKNF